MGDFLVLTIEKVAPSVQETYWWVLIFEGMRRGFFQFHRPGDAAKRGVYFSPDNDEVTCTFQEVWDILYAKSDHVLASFWSAGNIVEPFRLQVSVNEKIHDRWQIDVSLAEGYLSKRNEQQSKERIKAFLQVCLACYELCFPCSIKLLWDDDATQTSLIQARPKNQEDYWERATFCGHDLAWREIGYVGTQCLSAVDPIPIPEGIGPRYTLLPWF